MPSLDLFLYFQDHLQVHKVTYLNGMHYSRCLEAWLKLQDKQRAALAPLFQVCCWTRRCNSLLANACTNLHNASRQPCKQGTLM